MAKRIKRSGTTKSDLKDSLKNVGKKSNARLSYFNITEEDISRNPEQVVKELSNTIAMIPLSQVSPNADQPRKDFDEEALQELAESIKVYGLIQPITVRRFNEKEYQLISGERRWRASQLAGLTEIPAYIRIANDQEMMEMALVENIQRENLNPLEIAITYQRLIDEFKLTHDELGERVGRKRATVTHFLALLKLPPVIQEDIFDGKISFGHAKALAYLKGGFPEQSYWLEKIREEKLSVRALEMAIKAAKDKQNNKTPKSKAGALPEEYINVEKTFQEFFGSKKNVKLKLKATGKGQITLNFNNVEELNQLLDRLED
jgi:ParB family chromosome partitioning protein